MTADGTPPVIDLGDVAGGHLQHPARSVLASWTDSVWHTSNLVVGESASNFTQQQHYGLVSAQRLLEDAP